LVTPHRSDFWNVFDKRGQKEFTRFGEHRKRRKKIQRFYLLSLPGPFFSVATGRFKPV